MKRANWQVIIAVNGLMLAGQALADCRSIEDNAHVQIDPAALERLAKIDMDRERIIAAMVETANPETVGCWAGASGDFDDQHVSVGFAQWNFGQGSLQPLLRAYKAKYPQEKAWLAERDRLMPTYGAKLFSSGCLRNQVTAECLEFLASVQARPKGKLVAEFRDEITALFESDAMTQVQTDAFVRLIGSVAVQLEHLFAGMEKTPLRVKWALDLKVQQGGFPLPENVQRVRKRWSALSPADRNTALARIFGWYEALCYSPDQDGVRWDCDYNVRAWKVMQDKHAITDEAADLILLTHLRSRIAANKSGLYQADTFQRRAKIALGVGSVHGRRDQEGVKKRAADPPRLAAMTDRVESNTLAREDVVP